MNLYLCYLFFLNLSNNTIFISVNIVHQKGDNDIYEELLGLLNSI